MPETGRCVSEVDRTCRPYQVVFRSRAAKLEMRGVMGGMWNRVANYETIGKRFATAACFATCDKGAEHAIYLESCLSGSNHA